MRSDEVEEFYAKIQANLTVLVTNAIRQLLENRHLYQKVEIDVKELMLPVRAMSKQTGPPGDAARAQARALKCYTIPTWQWAIESDRSTGGSKLHQPDHLVIPLPTIKIFCPKCDRVEPFNPRPNAHSTMGHQADGKSQQLFVLAYDCQSCKGLPTVFMIRRAGLKLFLEGRSPMEQVDVPKVIPKGQKKYYSDAIVAHNSGQTLAGLFLLRTFIEQYMRDVLSDSGLLPDKLIEKYMEQLPKDFKERFPSLGRIYSELSTAIHSANTSAELFDKTIADLNEHFEAKKLFKIIDKKSNSSPD
jgi:hypothetical protein